MSLVNDQPLQLYPTLLYADARTDASHPTFSATLNAHGEYETQTFVLRLSPEIHRKLASITPGISTNGQAGFENVQAMSTYLHETIHWWQHIGSTYGLVFSLVYPIQSHCTHFDLLALVESEGFEKSVLKQSIKLNERGPTGFGTAAGRANTIINNHFDLFAFRAFTLGPEVAKAVTQEQLFEAVGHAFHMTYAHAVNTIASTVDPQFRALPHPKEWADGFRQLREDKIEGHYYGSGVGLWPIGSYEIFEGQARFSQIQYLSHACGHRLDWDDFRALGMLSGVYVKAFAEFLHWSDAKWPAKINDPIVSLFLLVCDLALNPGSGFPVAITHNFVTFIDDVNPGARFCLFCRLIAKLFPTMKSAIESHSRAEYDELTGELCYGAKEIPPLSMAALFAQWFKGDGPLSSLRKEYDNYSFDPANFVVRHLFAHFLAFQEDKLKTPEFFCWPGAWMAGELVSEEQERLFDKHGALFIDKENDDSVFPRLPRGRDEVVVHRVFKQFYDNAVTFDLTNQWISKEGPFAYDLTWLSASASSTDMKNYSRQAFVSAFGFDPETVKILP